MQKEADLAGAGRGFDLVGAVDEMTRSSFHPQPIECSLAERVLGAFAEVGWHVHVVGLKGALERSLELTVSDRFIERLATDRDPGAAARRTSANVWRDGAVGTERKADQRFLAVLATSEDAGPFGTRAIGLIVRA